MVALLKYMKGYVRIRVWGMSSERFMNLCSNRDILLWDIKKTEEGYTMCISLRGFYQLRPIARKTGTRVVILQRMGLPFFVPVILSRKIFCLGLILCVAFWIGSSYCVWDVECSGNYQITDDVLMHFLKEHDVKVGMLKRKLDIEELEKEIRRTFPAVTWTSAKLDGTKLIIDIKENDVPLIPVIKEDEGGKNLISQYDGTVVSMIVRKGVPKVVIGDTITQGTILVEGMIPIYNEDTTVKEYQFVTSDADIFIRHQLSHQEVLPFDYIKKEYTGREKKGYYFRFGEKEIRFFMEQPFLVYDSLIKEKSLRVLEKLDIPLYFGQITYREYQNVEYRYEKEQAKELMLQKIKEFFATLEEKGVHIIEKNVRIDTEGDQWVLTAEMMVEEVASELVEIPAENNQSSVEADAVE